VGFPHHNEAIPVWRWSNPVSKLFLYFGLLIRDLKTLEQVVEFLPTLRALDWRVGHPIGHVQQVSRDIEPSWQILFHRLMDAGEESGLLG
jgi:hypothetical protein